MVLVFRTDAVDPVSRTALVGLSTTFTIPLPITFVKILLRFYGIYPTSIAVSPNIGSSDIKLFTSVPTILAPPSNRLCLSPPGSFLDDSALRGSNLS